MVMFSSGPFSFLSTGLLVTGRAFPNGFPKVFSSSWSPRFTEVQNRPLGIFWCWTHFGDGCFSPNEIPKCKWVKRRFFLDGFRGLSAQQHPYCPSTPCKHIDLVLSQIYPPQHKTSSTTLCFLSQNSFPSTCSPVRTPALVESEDFQLSLKMGI